MLALGDAPEGESGSMPGLTYKEDLEETRERFLAWWRHEYFGRCAFAVTAPRENPPDVPKPPDARTPEERWYDLDWISRDMEYRPRRCSLTPSSITVAGTGLDTDYPSSWDWEEVELADPALAPV